MIIRVKDQTRWTSYCWTTINAVYIVAVEQVQYATCTVVSYRRVSITSSFSRYYWHSPYTMQTDLLQYFTGVLVACTAWTVADGQRHNSSTLWVGRLLIDTLFDLTPSGQSDQCTKDLQTYRENVANLTLWAVKMLDASSKGPSGLLSGDNYQLGHYDQCLSVSVPDIRISGQYTIVKINFVPTKYTNYRPLGIVDYREPSPKTKVWAGTKPSSDPSKTPRDEFHWAVCHPDSCSPERLKSILTEQLKQVSGLNISVDVDPLMSSKRGDAEPMGVYHYIFFSAIGLNLAMVAIGTWYDVAVLGNDETHKRGMLKNLLKPFSVTANAKRLLKKNSDPELSIINGLKVISVCHVILGHRMLVLLANAISNPEFNVKAVKTVWYSYFDSPLIVETFFVISGFLTYHVVIKEIERTKSFSLVIMLFYRWLRIFPVYASLIAVYVFALPYIGDGPLWKSIVYKESERCKISWWSNLIFLNNYLSTDNFCIIPSWYLACDMHFFLLGSLLTYAAWKNRKAGVGLMLTALAVSMFVPSKIIYDNKYWGSQPVYINAIRDVNSEPNFKGMYVKSHTRATTYLVGLLMAVLYEKLKRIEYQFSKQQLFLSVIFCIVMGNAAFLSTYILYTPGKPYDPWVHMIFFTATRTTWALIISLAIIAHGTTGLNFISDFLGHELFNCLGKLTYCVYMYQELIQFITVGSMRSPGYASHTLLIWMTCGDITSTYIIAVIVNFMIESPCDKIQKNLMKLLIKGKKNDIVEETRMKEIKSNKE
ncbi:nose resistant to fluoxetine protein 6-like isoform X2 [Adelges cooleyi]|uniref:nose resistant to fluoxetine protein 6-like isoform X2 n=1 Tax=Adelges cooleyi TaxID=133065 RepID=UPI00217F474D|nr:nose resistant to fluoxetine protein 6-like isoform X2 [Adelges cooleyi]